ncbi:MAG: pirin family protein [Deltaproteobacteria bacterium]|nr:pirin family protein [Deltaproteobacteria bacterium]
MIIVRRATERQHGRSRKQENWCTFDLANTADPLAHGFGTLEKLNEIRLAPGAGVPRCSRHDAEVVTYVHEGVLAYEDSIGHSGVVQTGEFQRVTSGRGLRHSKMNASRTDWAHFYQIWLRASEAELEPGHELKRFSAADRRNRLSVVASLDARRGSLRIYQDALVYSSLLDPGQHVVHELSPGRSAWLHLVRGEGTLGNIVLTTGDGAGLTAEPAVSLTASEASEILLVDVGRRSAEVSNECWPSSIGPLSSPGGCVI